MITEFDYYRTFYIVAKTQNITQAARELCVSQPSVTKAIHNLESLLDCQLFSRSKKGVQLTPAGKILYKRVQPAYLMLTAAEQELKGKEPSSDGCVRIGTGAPLYNYYLLPYISKFCDLYPSCKLELVDLDESDNTTIKYTNADICIDTPWIMNDTTTVNVETLTFARELVVAGKKYSFLRNSTLTISKIVQYPLIMVSRNFPVRNYYEELFLSHGVTLNPKIEVSDASFLAALAARNLGICFIRSHYAEHGLTSGELVELNVDFPLMDGGELLLITPKNRPLSPEARAFLELLEES